MSQLLVGVIAKTWHNLLNASPFKLWRLSCKRCQLKEFIRSCICRFVFNVYSEFLQKSFYLIIRQGLVFLLHSLTNAVFHHNTKLNVGSRQDFAEMWFTKSNYRESKTKVLSHWEKIASSVEKIDYIHNVIHIFVSTS